jgi:hypothetical protein
MARNRGLVSLFCAAALVVACNKGGGGTGGTGGGGNPLTGGGGGSGGASALDYMPKETGLIIGFNWSKFKGTKFYDMLVAAVPPDGKKELDDVKAACGIDYLSDFDSVLIAAGSNMDKQKVVIVVKGNWNEDKVAKCATAMGEKKGKKITVAKDGNITTYTTEGEHPVYVAWVDSMAIVTPSSMDGDKTYLAEILKKASSVKDNKDFMDLFSKTDQSGTMFGALLTTPEMAGSLGKATGGSEKMTGGYMTLKLASGLDVNAALRFATDADAKSVSDRVNQELDGAKKSNPQAAEFLKNASIAPSAKDMVVKLSLDDKQLDQLMQMVKQMIPMLGMMMGGGGQ